MGGQRIGVFDSGMGGLTVLRALRRTLPGADFLYLGDTARLPYGTKSAATVTQYALQSARLLVARKVDLLVIACNTASATALPALTRAFAPLPVIGVVEPGAEAGVAATTNRHIAVIATESTVRGGAYPKAIAAHDPRIRVTQAACPIFVALAEEGWTEGPATEAAAARYLLPLFADRKGRSDPEVRSDPGGRPDTLVLGCTHFPVLKAIITKTVGAEIAIVDSAETTARQVAASLGAGTGSARGETRFLVTDSPERFARVGSVFLGAPIAPATVELIDSALVVPE